MQVTLSGENWTENGSSPFNNGQLSANTDSRNYPRSVLPAFGGWDRRGSVSERFRVTDGGSPAAAAPDSPVATEGPPVLIVDAAQRCVEVNDAASRILGMTRAELVGRSVESIDLPEGHLLVLPRIEDGDAGDGWAARKLSGDDRPKGRSPSRREREILGLLAGGSTDAQIAAVLNLSPATVQTHVRNAKAKLGARTRAQAVALALVGGLIELD
jgi:DNA-binding CsgD family transcriptional regulator